MPLIEGKSEKSFGHNVRAEMRADKPLKQSLAIAYAMKRKAQKRDRQEDEEEHDAMGGMSGFHKDEKMSGYEPHKYAEGGLAEFERDEERSGYDHGKLPCPDCESGHCSIHGADMMEHGGDVVERIMKKGMKHMSLGGRVANEDHGPDDEDLAGFLPNEFDDLSLRDDLEQHYTGANSGDEIGDEQEDEDRRDIVSRAMRSMAKKDRMPIPGYGTSYGRSK